MIQAGRWSTSPWDPAEPRPSGSRPVTTGRSSKTPPPPSTRTSPLPSNRASPPTAQWIPTQSTTSPSRASTTVTRAQGSLLDSCVTSRWTARSVTTKGTCAVSTAYLLVSYASAMLR
nr:mucin-2-like [Salvelinus alpinus]